MRRVRVDHPGRSRPRLDAPATSVAERPEMVPPHLRPWHVRAHGGNVGASGAVLHALADAEEAARRAGTHGARVDLAAARELVRRANAAADRPPSESEPAVHQGQPAGGPGAGPSGATRVTARSLSWSRDSEEPIA